MEVITSLLGAVMLVLVGVVLVLALVIVALHEARYIVYLGRRLRSGGTQGGTGRLTDSGPVDLGAG